MNINRVKDIVEIALATKIELVAYSVLLTFFLVALGKLYPLREENMWWFNWRGPPPLPPHTSSFSSVYVFQECSICYSVPILSVSSRFFVITFDIYSFFKLHRSVFLHWSHHNNFSPFLSIHHLSLHLLNPLLLGLYISLPPVVPLFPYPQLCYFLLCMEDTFSLWSLGKWWLH